VPGLKIAKISAKTGPNRISRAGRAKVRLCRMMLSRNVNPPTMLPPINTVRELGDSAEFIRPFSLTEIATPCGTGYQPVSSFEQKTMGW
jgi:hypothetical protein